MIDIDITEIDKEDFSIEIFENFDISFQFDYGSIRMSYCQYEKLKEAIKKFES